MFKFQLNQTIYYLRDNKVHSAIVLSRKYVDNLKEHYNTATDTYKRFGPATILYATVHDEVKESEAFESKEALIASL